MPVLALLLLLLQGDAYRRGVALFEQGRLEEAAAALHEAVEAEPKNAQVWKALGVVYAAQGDYMSAAEPFGKACELDNRLPDACYYHGRALYALNRFEDAITPLTRAVFSDAVRGRAETALAECYEALGRNDEAEQRFLAAIRRKDAALERARTAYARFLIRAGRAEESLRPLRDALRANAKSAEAHFQSARALQQLDKVSEALEHAEQAVTLEPQRAPARLLLARLYRRLGRDADAEREEKAALALQGSASVRD